MFALLSDDIFGLGLPVEPVNALKAESAPF
jgi:hypothetical protein